MIRQANIFRNIQQSNEELYQPQWGLILFIALVFGVPTVCCAIQMNAALNQPNNQASLEKYSIQEEMFYGFE